MQRAAFCAAFLVLTGCGGKETPEDAQVRKGRTQFIIHCSSCHGTDPTREGALGPAIHGSSLELLQARILRGEYPPGYVPKRATKIMQKLPITEPEIQALHAFLNSKP